MSQTKTAEHLPKTIGRYQILGLLGQGGLARVFRARDPVLGRDVAIKLVEPSIIEKNDAKEMRFMFHREACATAALQHPGIIEIYDYSGPTADLLYMASELLQGPTLRHILEEKQTLAPALVAALAYELSLILEHAHTRNIIHRDLKPENIFWLESGRLVLADFGIAKVFSGRTVEKAATPWATNIYGSPLYMAKEQLEQGVLGPHTDIYALGVIMFEALTGRNLIPGDTTSEILHNVQHPKGLAADERLLQPRFSAHIPHELTNLIESMTHPDWQKRPSSVVLVTQELRDILDQFRVSDPRLALTTWGEKNILCAQLSVNSPLRNLLGHLYLCSHKIGHFYRRFHQLFVYGLLYVVVFSLGFGLGWSVHRYKANASAADQEKREQTSMVFVVFEIHFKNKSKLWIDAVYQGTKVDKVTLMMPPGIYTLEARTDNSQFTKNIYLMADTTPVFEF